MNPLTSTLILNPFQHGELPVEINYDVRPTLNEKGFLLELIKNQIEYYFSAENLPKDVFLNKLMQLDESGEGWVNLQTVANFNKIKQLTNQLDVVREALSSSSIVVLSDDGLYIKRKVPITKEKDTNPEKRSLYISKVPKNCDKESLFQIFGEFGTIIRLDLPIDKKSGENKGIAFVEYQTEGEMQKALEKFNTSGKYKMVVKPFKSKKNETPKDSQNIKQTNEDGINGNEEKAKNVKQMGEKKEKKKKDNNGEIKVKDVIGRELYISPDYGKDAWNTRSRSNSNTHAEWEPNPSNASQRPKLHLKGQMESGKPLFVPIRNPFGPDVDGGRGFSAGRGKLIPK